MDIAKAEAEYKWLDAAKLYEQSASVGDSSAPDSWRRIGFCYELASRQAKNAEDFTSVPCPSSR